MTNDIVDHDLKGDTRVIPVTVLTGFLGAGKTTLLNRILTGDHGLRIAVLVNDFGAINIDADLVVGVEGGGDIVSLANGCVCCNIRDDLMSAVKQVAARPERPEYIVLEASGVAEPSGIAMTFIDASLHGSIRLDSILCVMDASQIFSAPELLDLKLRQIAFADMLILNKTDLVSRDEIARIRAWLDERFSRVRLIEASRGAVPLAILLASGRFDATRLDEPDRENSNPGEHAHGREHEHTDDCHDPHCTLDPGHGRHPDHVQQFATWSFETDAPLSLELLRDLVKKLPASIYRCKGVIHSVDAPGRRAILQVVGKRVDIALEQEWGARVPRTQIVAIGAHGALDKASMRERFERCVARLR